MRSRFAAILIIGAFLSSSCGGAAPAATLGPFDQALVDKLIAQGLDEPEAIILAMTKVVVVSGDGQVVHLLESYPTGDSVDVTFTRAAAVSADPSAVTLTSAPTTGGFTFRLGYTVAQGASQAPGARLVVARIPQHTTTIGSANEGFWDVVMNATVVEGSKQVFDVYVEKLEKYLEAEGSLSPEVQYLKSVGSLFEALDLSAEYKKLSLQVDELERCAKNPTNELTIKAYQEDPGARDRILQQVEATRIELKANTSVLFLGVIDSLASDLTKNPLVGWIAGTGTAVNKTYVDGLNEATIGRLEKAITKCKEESAPPSDEAPSPADTAAETAPPATLIPDLPAGWIGSVSGSVHTTNTAGDDYTDTWEGKNLAFAMDHSNDLYAYYVLKSGSVQWSVKGSFLQCELAVSNVFAPGVDTFDRSHRLVITTSGGGSSQSVGPGDPYEGLVLQDSVAIDTTLHHCPDPAGGYRDMDYQWFPYTTWWCTWGCHETSAIPTTTIGPDGSIAGTKSVTFDDGHGTRTVETWTWQFGQVP